MFLLVKSCFSQDIEEEKQNMISLMKKIEKKLDKLNSIRRKLEVLRLNSSELQNQLIGNHPEYERKLYLVSVDSARTKDYTNFHAISKIFSKPDPVIKDGQYWQGYESAPLFIYRPFEVTTASRAVFEPFNGGNTAAYQVRLDFYYDGKEVFTSELFDLPEKYEDPVDQDFGTEVLFDEIVANVFQNHGYLMKTTIPHFHIYGHL